MLIIQGGSGSISSVTSIFGLLSSRLVLLRGRGMTRRIRGGLRLFYLVSVEYCLSLVVVRRRGLFSNRFKLSCEKVPFGIFVMKVELDAVIVTLLLKS